MPCTIYEELLTNPKIFITRSGTEKASTVIWDKEKCTYNDPNELHNEESMEGIFEGTDLTALDLDQDPQDALKKK